MLPWSLPPCPPAPLHNVTLVSAPLPPCPPAPLHNVTLVSALPPSQSLRPELSDQEDHEELTGLDILMEGDQKHSSATASSCSSDRGEGQVVIIRGLCCMGLSSVRCEAVRCEAVACEM